MEIKDIILAASAIVGALGLFIGGAGYLLTKFKGGTKEAKQESTDILNSNDQIKQFYKEQNEDYKAIIAGQNSKIQDLIREVGEIRGQLNAEQKQNKLLQEIFQNRNPEMEAFMKYMVESAEKHSQTHESMLKVLTDLHAMSSSNHEMLQQDKNQDIKIEGTLVKKSADQGNQNRRVSDK